jgi:FMN-dependent oxidoreductase (nitrilotriacetate monooxygenase family)
VAKLIGFNAFTMNCVMHINSTMWRHPRDRSREYTSLAYWTNLATTLERGLFDGVFLADVLGVYDVYGGSADTAIRYGVQFPVNDPMMVVPAMAHVTEHLGFGITAVLPYESPLPFARRMSTLDHLTDGRIGWNIVTGYLQSAAQGTGLSDQPSHDTRYEMAEEYMEVMYQLWEGSWEDGAVLGDRAAGVLTDPSRIHKVRHHGRYLDVEGYHLSEPSRQRTPVLYQAGGSPAGRAFAAKHAECVFLGGGTRTATVGRVIADVRARAAAAGRDPNDLKMFPLMTVIVAPTDAEAEDKVAEYRECVVPEAALALVSGWSGVDFAQWGLDDEVQNLHGEGIQGTIKALQLTADDGGLTVRRAAADQGLGGAGPVIVGSPTRVADELERWIDETDADGFNLTRVVMPDTYDDIVDLLVPELQRRGRYKRAYEPGTFRHKLLRQGPWLAPSHVGRSYRRTRP